MTASTRLRRAIEALRHRISANSAGQPGRRRSGWAQHPLRAILCHLGGPETMPAYIYKGSRLTTLERGSESLRAWREYERANARANREYERLRAHEDDDQRDGRS